MKTKIKSWLSKKLSPQIEEDTMIKFKPGERVVVIQENNELVNGTVKNAVDEIEIAIVNLDDSRVVKVGYSDIGKIKEQRKQASTKPAEKSEITITPDEFRKLAVKLAATEFDDSPGLAILVSMFLAKLHEALFIDGAEHD